MIDSSAASPSMQLLDAFGTELGLGLRPQAVEAMRTVALEGDLDELLPELHHRRRHQARAA